MGCPSRFVTDPANRRASSLHLNFLMAFANERVIVSAVYPNVLALLTLLADGRYSAQPPLKWIKRQIVKHLGCVDRGVQATWPVLITGERDAMQELIFSGDESLPWGLRAFRVHVGCEKGDETQCDMTWHDHAECVFMCICGLKTLRVPRPEWTEETTEARLWWAPLERKHLEQSWLQSIVWMTPERKVCCHCEPLDACTLLTVRPPQAIINRRNTWRQVDLTPHDLAAIAADADGTAMDMDAPELHTPPAAALGGKARKNKRRRGLDLKKAQRLKERGHTTQRLAAHGDPATGGSVYRSST